MYKQVYDEIGATVTAYKNSKHELHRLDGPALETSRGLKEWYVDGKLHRLDGPAVIQPNRYKAWYLDDKFHMLFHGTLFFMIFAYTAAKKPSPTC